MNIYNALLREGIILNESKNHINELVILLESNEDNTFVWDLSKEKLDKSLSNIDSESKAKKYLTMFLNKISRLSSHIRIKLVKYVILSLIGVLSYNSITSVVHNQDPEVYREISKISPEELKTDFIGKYKNIKSKRIRNSSKSLIKFLKHEEGDAKEKGQPVLTAYELGDGMITIGWGHAEKKTESKIKKGQKISRVKAEKLLKSDIEESEAALNRILNAWEEQGIKMNITQGMYDAMTSMIFNMGIGNFRKSEFIQLVKKGKYNEAKNRILTTNVSYPGHEYRREKEAEMFGNNLNENVGQKQSVSINYLKGLLNNVTNNAAKRILMGWISKGGDTINLTPKQIELLKDIKMGGPKTSFYGTKN